MGKSKNRIKSLRKIQVEGQEYIWNVTDKNHDGDGSARLKIWKDKVVQLEQRINEDITPGLVEKLIRKKVL